VDNHARHIGGSVCNQIPDLRLAARTPTVPIKFADPGTRGRNVFGMIRSICVDFETSPPSVLPDAPSGFWPASFLARTGFFSSFSLRKIVSIFSKKTDGLVFSSNSSALIDGI
jgi:hypothetical protein